MSFLQCCVLQAEAALVRYLTNRYGIIMEKLNKKSNKDHEPLPFAVNSKDFFREGYKHFLLLTHSLITFNNKQGLNISLDCNATIRISDGTCPSLIEK